MSTIRFSEEYKDELTDVIEQFRELEITIFTAIVNLGMKGVYSSIHAYMEEGDSYDFEPAMFEDTGDKNLDHLLKLLCRVRRTRNKLAASI